MRPRRGVHPDVADPHRGQFFRRLLQEQVVEERGRAQEGRTDEETNGGKRGRAHIEIYNGLGGCLSYNEVVHSKRTCAGRGRRRKRPNLSKWNRRFRARQSFSDEVERNEDRQLKASFSPTLTFKSVRTRESDEQQ